MGVLGKGYSVKYFRMSVSLFFSIHSFRWRFSVLRSADRKEVKRLATVLTGRFIGTLRTQEAK